MAEGMKDYPVNQFTLKPITLRIGEEWLVKIGLKNAILSRVSIMEVTELCIGLRYIDGHGMVWVKLTDIEFVEKRVTS